MPKKSNSVKNHESSKSKNSAATTNSNRKTNRPSTKPKRKSEHRSHKSSRGERVPERSTKNKVLSIISDVFFYLLLFVSFSAIIMTVLGKTEGMFIFGYRPVTVLTNSMHTTDGSHKDGFAAGDLIILKQIKGQDAKKGDIITFYTDEKNKKGLLTHRVVKTLDHYKDDEKPYVVTKGDANTGNDTPVPITAVIGKKVYTIPKVGSFITFIKENIIATVAFVGVFVLIYLGLRKYLNLEEEKRMHPPKKAKRR